jgi:hypothetical protein
MAKHPVEIDVTAKVDTHKLADRVSEILQPKLDEIRFEVMATAREKDPGVMRWRGVWSPDVQYEAGDVTYMPDGVRQGMSAADIRRLAEREIKRKMR